MNSPLELMEEGKRLAAEARHDEAVALYDQALDGHRDHVAHDTSPESLNDLGRILTNRAIALQDLERFEEARANVEEAVRIRRKLVSAGHEQYRKFLLNGLRIAAHSCCHLDDHDAELAHQRQAARAARKLIDRGAEDLPFALDAIVQAANALFEAGERDEAERVLSEAIEKISRHTLDTEGQETLASAGIRHNEMLEKQGRCADAINAAERALTAARSAANPGITAGALATLAESLEHVGRFGEALQNLREADHIYAHHEAPNVQTMSNLMALFGRILRRQNRNDEARTVYTRLVALLRSPVELTIADHVEQVELSSRLAEALKNRADCGRVMGADDAADDYHASIDLWLSVIASTDLDDRAALLSQLLDTFTHLAAMLCASGKCAESADVAARAQAAGVEHGADADVVLSLKLAEANCRGDAGTDQRPRSLALYDDVIASLRTATGDVLQRTYATALFSRGDFLAQDNRWSEALHDFTASIATWERVGVGEIEANAVLFGRAMAARARLLQRESAYAPALLDAEKAIALLRPHKSGVHMLARALSLKGDVLESLERCGEAAGAHDEAITYFGQVNDTGGLATALADRGFSLLHVKRASDAIALFRRADELWSAVCSSEELPVEWLHLRALSLMADALGDAGELKGAVDVYLRLLDLSRNNLRANAEDRGELLFDLGVTLSRLDRDEDALPYLDEAVTEFLRLDTLTARRLLARAFEWRGIALGVLERKAEAVDAWTAAADTAEAAFAMSGEEADHLAAIKSRVERTLLLATAETLDESIEVLDKLEDELESMERTSETVMEQVTLQIRAADLMEANELCEPAAELYREAERLAMRQYDEAGDTNFRCRANDLRISAGFSLLHTGDFAAASELAKTAVEEARVLSRDDHRKHRYTLAQALCLSAHASEALEQCAEAVARFDDALLIWDVLSREGDADATAASAAAYTHRATSLHHVGRVDDAMRSATRAVEVARELNEGRSVPDYIERLAYAIEEKADLLEATGAAPIAAWHRSEAKRLRAELEHDDE